MRPIFRKVFLHIGSHKTGTSALQWYLDENRKVLLDNYNILYPKAGQWIDKSHHHWAFSIWGHGAKSLDDLVEELEIEQKSSGGAETLILSSELFEKIPLSLDLVETLDSLLQQVAHEVVCVYFVRRQDLLIESVFKQWVKDPKVRLSLNAPDFIRRELDKMDFLRISNAWESLRCRPDMKIEVYREGCSPINSFLTSVEAEGKSAKLTKVVNPSLDGKRLELKFFTNSLPLSESEDRNILKSILATKERDEVISLFDPSERLEFLENFSESNSALFSTYGSTGFETSTPHRDRKLSEMSGEYLYNLISKFLLTDQAATNQFFQAIVTKVSG